jgi:hypothetical protein
MEQQPGKINWSPKIAFFLLGEFAFFNFVEMIQLNRKY